MPLAAPIGLLAELTHRCPLGCPYCSNPFALESRESELDTATWMRVFNEAAQLGVLQVHLSGGEPGARRDLVELAACAREAGLYTNLITSGLGITTRTMRDLYDAGLEHVQVSIHDSDAVSSDHTAGELFPVQPHVRVMPVANPAGDAWRCCTSLADTLRAVGVAASPMQASRNPCGAAGLGRHRKFECDWEGART